MAINKITGFNVFSNEPIDSRQIAYATTAAAIAAIPEVFRYVGLTVPIFENGSLGDEIIEYWWEKGVTDGDLVVKLPVFDDLPVSTFNNDVGYFNNASFSSVNGNFTLNVGNDSPALPDVVVNLDGRYILLSEKAVPNGVATLDASGLIPSSQIPPLAITEYLGNFADTTAALANAGVQASQRGDWFTVDSNDGESWIVTSDSPTLIGDITKLSTPSDAVLSVNGQIGVVSLDAGDIGFTPYLTITSTDVQAAIEELKDEIDNVSGVTIGSTNQIPRSNSTNSDFVYESFFSYDRTTTGLTSYGANLAGDFRKELGSGGDIVRFGTEVEPMGTIYGAQGGLGDNFGLNSRPGYDLTFRTNNTIRLTIDQSNGNSDFEGNTIIAGRAEIDNVAVDGNGYIVSRTDNDRYFLTTNLFGNNGYRIGYLYDDANTSAGYIEFDRITDTDEYVRLLFLFTRPNLTTWQPIAISSNDESILFNGIDINVTGNSPINVNYGPLEATLPNWDNTFQLVTSIGGRNRSTSVGSWEWFWPDGEPAGLGWDKGFRMGTLSTNDSSSSVSNANNLLQISFDTTVGFGDIPSGVNYLTFSEGNALESYIASDYLQLYSVKDDIQPTFNNGIPLADDNGIINSALVGNQGNGSYIAFNSTTSSWEVLGKDFESVFTSPFTVNVTTPAFTTVVNQNFNLPRTGNYLVHISYAFSGNTATSDVVTNGSFGGNDFGSINSEIMRVEPKDQGGNEFDGRGTDQKYPFGRYYYFTGLSAGVNNLLLGLSSPSGVTVSIWDIVIVVKEVR